MTGDRTREELITRASAGDRYAFERLLVEYYDRLDRSIRERLQRLYRPLCAVLSSEDVLQHTFTKAWGRWRDSGPRVRRRSTAGWPRLPGESCTAWHAWALP